MFSTENHKIFLRQFGVMLSRATEESSLTASQCRLLSQVAREENLLRKLMVPENWEPLMNNKYGMVSCRKLITSKICSNDGVVCGNKLDSVKSLMKEYEKK